MSMIRSGHFVQFFNADDQLVAAVGEYLREGLETGCTCVVAATPGHHRGLAAHLQRAGLDPGLLEAQYRYVTLDARTTLTQFMRFGRPDRARFHQHCGRLMMQAAARGQPICVTGEMTALLIEDGLEEAAIELEELWNELSRQFNFTLYCPYRTQLFEEEYAQRTFEHVCAVHSHVLPAS